MGGKHGKGKHPTVDPSCSGLGGRCSKRARGDKKGRNCRDFTERVLSCAVAIPRTKFESRERIAPSLQADDCNSTRLPPPAAHANTNRLPPRGRRESVSWWDDWSSEGLEWPNKPGQIVVRCRQQHKHPETSLGRICLTTWTARVAACF